MFGNHVHLSRCFLLGIQKTTRDNDVSLFSPLAKNYISPFFVQKTVQKHAMCGFVRPKMTPEHQMCWQKVYILSHKISSLDQNRCRNLQCVLFSSLSLYLLKKGTCLYYLETYPLKLDGFVR